MKANEIDERTHWLFNRTYGAVSKELHKEIRNRVKQQVSDFGWEKTFESWKNYFLLNVQPLNQQLILRICSGVTGDKTIQLLNHINS